jgi:low temperature requirement protein LtrA
MPAVRRSQDGGAYRASFLELFYDLVFVFAVTQVSHYLLDHLTWSGAGEATLILLVVWWSWQFTTWATNELDPDVLAVRLLMMALMLGSLLMAIAIPEAFGDKGLLFAAAYVAIQIGRTAFLAFAAGDPGSLERRRAENILVWFCVSGVFWIAGGVAEGDARIVLWLVALAIDYGGPLVTYPVPRVRGITMQSWTLGTEHFTERFGLFVIIALGETIVITGATTAELEVIDTATIAALTLAFLGTASFWWLYFASIQGRSEEALARTRESTRVARDLYAYGHALLVAGIIVAAVGDELVIQHPRDELPTEELLPLVAGPALYLLAQAFFRFRITGQLSARRLGGVAALVVVGLAAGGLPALAVAGLVVGVLIALCVADYIAIRSRPANVKIEDVWNLD